MNLKPQTLQSTAILPEAFAQRMRHKLNHDFEAFAAAHHHEAPVSIRLNNNKLGSANGSLAKVPWTESGLCLPERPPFALDPRWHGGAYYAQEPSSMFLEQAWKTVSLHLSKPPVILDLCAAPGGKSTHLAGLLPEGGLLVANEVIRQRAHILAENVTKWGTGNVIVTNNDPQNFGGLTGFFDTILIDAPCSGEGMFRKDLAAMHEWSMANVKLCAERQRRIIAGVWDALKPGGFLIYSTCTYSEEENEQLLAWIAENHEVQGVDLQPDADWNILETETNGLKGYRFYPHRLRGEGLFMAVVRKTDGATASPKKMKKPNWQTASRKEKDLAAAWVRHPETRDWLRWQDKLLALPAGCQPLVEQLGQHLRFVNAGVEVAGLIRDQANPLPALALFADVQTGAFATENLDLENALRFLKKEEIGFAHGTGWKLIVYEHLPLGWAKQIGHRANNYFPHDWRLRMDWRDVEKQLADGKMRFGI